MTRRRLLLAALCTLAASAVAGTPADAPARRDPFARPALPPAPAVPVPEPAPVPLRLRALILNGVRSLANIDGDVVAAGEHARDYQVLRIDARGVLVRRAGRELLLTIYEKEKQ